MMLLLKMMGIYLPVYPNYHFSDSINHPILLIAYKSVASTYTLPTEEIVSSTETMTKFRCTSEPKNVILLIRMTFTGT